MLDAFKDHGPGTFARHLASLVPAACDTTFYCLAVYAGAARLRALGNAVQGSLVAGAGSSLAAVSLAYLFLLSDNAEAACGFCGIDAPHLPRLGPQEA